MHWPNETPSPPVNCLIVLCGPLLSYLPMASKQFDTSRGCGSHRQHSGSETARKTRAGRRLLRCYRDLDPLGRRRAELQPSLPECEPFCPACHRLRSIEKSDDGFKRVFHHASLAPRIYTHHVRIRRQSPRAAPEHHTPIGQLIQEDDPIRYLKWMMERQRYDARPQPNPRCIRCGLSDDELRRGNVFVAARMVLSH